MIISNDTQTFTVRGQVRWADGKPLAAVLVQAADCDLRGGQVLGQVQTGQDGRYAIRYTAAQFSRAEKGSADLMVRAVNADGAEIATSSILFNAKAEATVDLIVGQAATGMPSEYERMVTELQPLLVNVTVAGKRKPALIDQLAALQASDLDFLTAETGIARAKLAMLAGAAVSETKAAALKLKIPAAVFYGLVREGLPADLAALGLTGQPQQRNALEQAFKANLIPHALHESLARFLEQLQQLTAGQALQAGAGTTKSVAAQLLGTALPVDKQGAFLTAYVKHGDQPIEDFWKDLRAQPAFSAHVDALQLALQLGVLTQNHVPLIRQLQSKVKPASMHDLVKLDAAAWTALVNQKGIGLPPNVPGDTPQAQTANYVNGIVDMLHAAFPNEAVAHMLATAPAINLDSAARKAVSQFFTNAPDFDLRSTRIDAYLQEHSAIVFKGIAEAARPKVVTQLKRTQRLLQVSTDAGTLAALMGTGFDSARAIAQMPRKSFLAQHAGALGGEEQALMLYQRAAAITTRSLHTYALLNDALNGAQPRALTGDGIGLGDQSGGQAIVPLMKKKSGKQQSPGNGQTANQASQNAAVVAKYIPNYTELFGMPNLCDCSECRSVLGPAAYMVDLLHFLETSAPNSKGSTPYDVLIGREAEQGQAALQGRRPDLAYLPLTCENTSTALPYVDLVNEVLESYIVLGHADKAAAHDTGTATSRELDANPQYTNDDAYRMLDQAVYPFTLPFNQPVAVARAYLENLGSSRYEVLDTFRKNALPATLRAINAEYLKITAEEYAILTGVNLDLSAPVPALPLYAYYGYNSNNLAALVAVPEFLSRTGIAYTDLVELLKTALVNPSYPQGQALDFFLSIPFSMAALTALKQSNFANPDQATLDALQQAGITLQQLIDWSNANFQKISKLVVLDAPDSSCDLSITRLQHLDGTLLTDAELSKLHRFIRLWRKMDWSIADLDRALTALQASDITPDVIDRLAQIRQLQNELKLPKPQVLLSLWATIDTHGSDALYNTLFLNKARLQIDAAFAPDPANGAVLTDAAARLSDHVSTLTAALRISEADLNAIRVHAKLLDDAGANPPAFAVLSLQNVSTLYRYAVLAKALKLRINDLISLKTLAGAVDPFATTDQTVRFVQLARKVQQSGFKVAALDYLYRHLSVAPAGFAPQPATVLALAKTLREGLTQIAQEHVLAADPAGDLTRGALALLFDHDIVDQTITMINGSAAYTAALAVLPDAIALKDKAAKVLGINPAKLPASVVNKTSYDPAMALLRFQGAMTTAEQAALLALSADAAYQQAVTLLYQQPMSIIQDALTGFLDPADAGKHLMRNTASLGPDLQAVLLDANGVPTSDEKAAVTTAIADKFAYVLTRLLPYLRDQLSHAFVRQTMANAFKVDNALVTLLLETVLQSQADAAQAASKDFLALATPGLSAGYFTADDLTGVPSAAIAPMLAFDGATLETSTPAGKASARWQGMLLAPNSGDFTFSVRSNGKVQLWVGDQTQALPLQLDPSTNQWTSSPVSLKAGQLYQLRMEARQMPAQNGAAVLSWQSAATPKAAIPADNFYPGALIDVLSAAYTRLQKSVLLANAFKLNTQELAYIAAPAAPQDFSSFNLNALPLARDPADAAQCAQLDSAAASLFAAWLRVNDFSALRNSLPRSTVSLIDVFNAASLDAAKQQLVQASGWDAGDIDTLAAATGLGAADFRNDIALQKLQACIRLVNRLGVSVAQLFDWSGLPADFTQLQNFYDQSHAIAQDIKKTVHAKYDEETWLTIAKPLNDGLRQSQRDALVAYLLPRLNMTSSNQLFDYFLIDVDMCACMETSRVKQALSSIQLFVQRCLLNLEERADVPALSVSPSAIDAEQWEWMKHYRVWEANRKVFLYPENWIVPELRDNKSPFFKELESELLQNEVTADTSETAFMNYLQKLDQVAHLEICGTYWEDKDPDSGEQVNILHVFARTFNTPRTYFYRQWVNYSSWTAWEKVPLDIEGDHLIPVIWNRRLHLVWPSFMQKLEAPPAPSINPTQTIDVAETKKYWEIRLVWSEYKQGKWQPKQMSTDFIASIRGGNSDGSVYTMCPDIVNHAFYADVGNDGALTVRAYVSQYNSLREFLGEYRFDASGVISIGCRSDLHDPHWEDMPLHPIEGIIGHDYLTPLAFVKDEDANGYEFNAWRGPRAPATRQLQIWFGKKFEAKTFLDTPPSAYRLLMPHQFLPRSASDFTLSPIGSLPQFFYQDAQRSYFVTPVVRADAPDAIARPDKVSPGPLIDSLIEVTLPDPIGPVIGGLGSPVMNTQPQMAKMAQTANRENEAVVTLSALHADSAPLQLDSFRSSGTWAVGESLQRNTWNYASMFQTYSTHLQFFSYFHPYVGNFVKALNRDGIPGLLSVASQQLTDQETLYGLGGKIPLGVTNTFQKKYKPEPQNVDTPYPGEIVDFDYGGAYSLYNWELFFHAPMLIAAHLTKNQRFADAMRWLQYVFNPSDDTLGEQTPARYWKVLPFKTTVQQRIDDMLFLLSSDDADLSQEQIATKKGLQAQVEELNENPFQPHLIARMRLSSYQKYVVMAYIDNLVAWGDQLFRQDTIEAINEATQLYVMAAELLGPRPQQLPSRGSIKPETYAGIRNQVKNQDLPDPIVAIENAFPFSTGSGAGPNQTGGLLGIGQALYFGVPQNDNLIKYWDTVDDRLFKIRNCMNIEGVVRQLALFEPPIDPAMLVQAAAHGVDLNSVLSDMNAPLPYYRFAYIQQKALEMCGEVRALGSALLAALEKKDAEELGLLRSTQEINIQNMMEGIKKQQVDEAQGQIDALMKSRATAGTRYGYYQTLLGASASLPGVNDTITLLSIPFKPESDGEGGLPLIKEEENEMSASHTAHSWTMASGAAETTGAMLHAIPDFTASAHPMGVGADVKSGGSSFGNSMAAVARGLNMLSSQYSYDASHSAKIAGFQRRSQEWSQQSNLAASEIMQIDKQIAVANIRLAIAEKELSVHQLHMQNAQDMQDFLNNKYTNQDLYAWTISDVSATYFQSYQMAYDLAKKAERAFRFERGLTSSNFIQFGYWDSLRKGLQSGERLTLALKQMERAYLDQNKREYEITKHVSLQLTDPMALIALKQTGQCEVVLPESLFDADYPGHYMRRIKSAGITLPCVVGPYTSINCTLTLLSNKTRISSLAGSQYAEDIDNGDSRFVTNFAAMQSIATSHAQNDNGMFELNFRDERYLPFEGAGAVSRWRIDLPIDTNAFDLDTLTDVVMHLKYTARDGGDILKNAARKAMNDVITDVDNAPLMRMFSARHEFPDDWYRFLHPVNPGDAGQSLTLNLSQDRFPYLFRGRALDGASVDVFLNFKDNALYAGKTALQFTLTPEGESSLPAATLDSIATVLSGTPHAKVTADLSLPSKLSLSVSETDVSKIAPDLIENIAYPGGSRTRLKADMVDDMLFVIHYSVS